MERLTAALLSVLCFLFAPSVTHGANLFATPGGGGDCSQAAPCTLGQALTSAGEFDSVYLAGGTYTSTGPGAVAQIPGTLLLRGGWDGTTVTPPVMDPDANLTVIDGEQARRGVDVTGPQGLLMRDLTVRNGFDPLQGGGIYADQSSLLLVNVTVENCGTDSGDTRDTAGGGIFLTGGDLTMISSTISGNGAKCSGCPSMSGGGVYAEDAGHLEVENCLFEKNDAWTGAAIFITNSALNEASISDSTFDSNGKYLSAYPSFAGYGGAVEARNSALFISDSTFTDNNGGNDGGALYVANGDLNLRRSRLSGNESWSGAGIFLASSSFTLHNVLLADNQPGTSTSATAGLRLHSSSSGTLLNTTITGVAGANRGRGVYLTTGSSVTASNLIVGRLAAGIEVDGSSSAVLDGTLWGTGGWANGSDYAGGGSIDTGTVNVYADPGFRAPASGDFHLLSTSAARDAGNPSGLTVDLDGVPRDASPDIGAYEYPLSTAVSRPRLLGERVLAGSTFPVRWAAPEEEATFTIRFSSNNGRKWQTLAKNVSGNRFDWAVPKMRGNKSRCFIKVIAYDSQGRRIGAARSDRFRIDAVFVSDPSKSETLIGGEKSVLFWWAVGTKGRAAKVILSYTLNGGRTWKRIRPAPAPFDPMAYSWTVPSPAKERNHCRVKVVLKNKAGRKIGSAMSERWFTILPP